MLYSLHDDRVVSRRVRQVLTGKFCKRADDHLLGLHEVYLHFVWGGPCRSATAEGMCACEFAVNREARVLSKWYRPHTYG